MGKQKRPFVVNNVAESPIGGFPGRITFPETFDGSLWKKWTDNNKSRPDDPSDGSLRLFPQWRIVTAIATIEIEGIPQDAPPETVDMRVIGWADKALMEWATPFLAYVF